MLLELESPGSMKAIDCIVSQMVAPIARFTAHELWDRVASSATPWSQLKAVEKRPLFRRRDSMGFQISNNDYSRRYPAEKKNTVD